MFENKTEIEESLVGPVNDLIKLLQEKEEIKQYQKAEAYVERNPWIQEMITLIKAKQQELVNFEYYEKPVAYKKTLEELNELNKEIEENISVINYKDTLYEADQIVQMIFSQLQEAVDEDSE